jgi:hypothetical protein
VQCAVFRKCCGFFWVVFIPLPAISTLLLLFSHGRFSSQRFQVVLWALAALVGVGLLLVLASTAWDEPLLRLWGVWSYILLAVVAFYLESRLWFLAATPHFPAKTPREKAVI